MGKRSRVVRRATKPPHGGTIARPATPEDNPRSDRILHPATTVWVTTIPPDMAVRVIVEPETLSDPLRLVALDFQAAAAQRVARVMRELGDYGWSCVCTPACGHVWLELGEPHPGMLTVAGLQILRAVGVLSQVQGYQLVTTPSFKALVDGWVEWQNQRDGVIEGLTLVGGSMQDEV